MLTNRTLLLLLVSNLQVQILGLPLLSLIIYKELGLRTFRFCLQDLPGTPPKKGGVRKSANKKRSVLSCNQKPEKKARFFCLLYSAFGGSQEGSCKQDQTLTF